MADPAEGVTAQGMITTGARVERIVPDFRPVLAAAIDAVRDLPSVSLYLYGSVANGTAAVGSSDVDLLAVNLPADRARRIASSLSNRFAELCRGVDVAVAAEGELTADSDEAYGFRVFLRHYCVRLQGPDHGTDGPAYPADRRAARGFDGDIGRSLAIWRREQQHRGTSELARSVARKTLLATAMLVSIHDHGWTTDRRYAAARWAEIEPGWAVDLRHLVRWMDVLGAAAATPRQVEAVLSPTGLVQAVVDSFATKIGLWPRDADGR